MNVSGPILCLPRSPKMNLGQRDIIGSVLKSRGTVSGFPVDNLESHQTTCKFSIHQRKTSIE